jgi:hypothetical protein
LPGIDHGVCGANQSLDHVIDRAKLPDPLSLRPLGQLLAVAIVFLGLYRFDKKQGLIDHVFSHLAVGSLVVLEKDKQLSGGKALFDQAVSQAPGMIGVGARHRC